MPLLQKPLLKNRTASPRVVAAHRRLIGMLPVPVLRQLYHVTMIHRRGNFTTPSTFNEKVNWRILNDRRDRIVAACDKMRMKEMARATYPGADLRIPATYWYGTDLRDAPDLTDLQPWVLKPNHSSGHALFGPDETTDLAALTAKTQNWWKQTPVDLGEWGYGEARPALLLEEKIPTPDGTPPADYKFFVFDGRVEFVQVNSGRFGHQTATFLDADWNRLPVRWRIRPVADEPRPAELDKMLQIATVLGAGWDFIRIDLYAVDGEVWFGEYTPYPGGGLLRYKPKTFDLDSGRYWQLPPLAEVQPGQP